MLQNPELHYLDNAATTIVATGVADVINKAIDEAIEEAKAAGIHGKATTPFLLAKVKDLTGGNSLASNIQLVYNNARLAAKTAAAYCAL